nr:uncharacterized protein LOC131770508 [Pocillopora verrucosa]
MSHSKKRVHLFNCDNTYKLEPVEKLLEKCGSHVERVEKHSFRLAKMSEMVDIIPTLEMNMAFFVVHAHESRLSINEDKAGIGYAKIYRALLQATGGEVVVVIGGDDNYKGVDEENREVISRWAKRKVSSQFSEECLDGRKSFIFSWNKQHREIHEQALLHHFDPNKKGQKFEYQPDQRKEQRKAATPPPSRSKEVIPPFRRCCSVSGERQYESEPPLKPESSLHHCEAVTGAREIKEEKNLDSRAEGGNISRNKANTSTVINLGAGSEEIIRPRIGETIELSILGCNVSRESVDDAKKLFAKVLPSLRLSKDPLVGNLPITEVEEYLRDYLFRFFVLVVDGYTVRDGCDDQRSKELKRLVRLAVDKVVEKVIILVCNGQSTTNTYNEFIGQINKLEKTFVAQVNNGKLAMDPDIFCSQVLNLPMTCSTPNTQFISQEQDVNADSLSTNSYNLSENYPQGNSSERKSIDDMSAQNSQQLVLATQFSERSPPVVVLRSFIRHGKISYQEEDLQICDPEFQVPDEIQRKLKECSHIPLLGVRIMKLSNGLVEYQVDRDLKQFKSHEKLQLASEKRLVLKTRVHNGKVSFEDNDVKYKYGNSCIPKYILDNLQKKRADGDLYIVLDDSDNFEAIVKESGKMERAADTFKQTKKRVVEVTKKGFDILCHFPKD